MQADPESEPAEAVTAFREHTARLRNAVERDRAMAQQDFLIAHEKIV